MMIRYIASILLFSLFLIGCTEKNDLVSFSRPSQGSYDLRIDSSYHTSSPPAAEQKRVLLEDFTGVQCLNCPNAQTTAAGIASADSPRVILVSAHVTALSAPLAKSKYDFRSDGEKILDLFGTQPTGLPQGAIDRFIFSGNSVYTAPNQWQNYVNQRLQVSTPVNISITNAHDTLGGKKLKIKVRVTYVKDQAVPEFLNVFLIESGMKDIQEIVAGYDTAYIQKHVLRLMVNPSGGLQLGQSFKAGDVFEASAMVDWHNTNDALKPAWIPANCRVVAFVSHKGTNDFEVLQVAETDVKP